MAWGCMPIVGDVKLQIMSERVVRTGFDFTIPEDAAENTGDEKLVVRWKTESKASNGSPPTNSSSTSSSSSTNNMNRGLSSLLGGDQPFLRLSRDPTQSPFSGLFIFCFDEEGRIVSHTIEHADEANGYDRTARVVSLTDWLIGKARGRQAEADLEPSLAYRWERGENKDKNSHHGMVYRGD